MPTRRGHGRPVLMSAGEAVCDIPRGATIALGGFGLCGLPLQLLAALHACATATDLTLITGTVGGEQVGIGPLLASRRVRRVVSSHLADNRVFAAALQRGDVELELCPMGTLTERMRAAGAGVAAFYTPTGYATAVAEGGLPQRFARVERSHHDDHHRRDDGDARRDKADGDDEDSRRTTTSSAVTGDVADVVVTAYSPPRETRCIDGRWCCYETALRADFALVHAWRADRCGNVVFRGTARNLNAVAARCARVCVVEVEELVDDGALDANAVHLPGVYVTRLVVLPPHTAKYVDYLVTRRRHRCPQPQQQQRDTTAADDVDDVDDMATHNDARHRIARRAALEVCGSHHHHHDHNNNSNKSDDGNGSLCVNLGVGIPALVTQYVPAECDALLMANSGVLGLGDCPSSEAVVDADVVNANKQAATLSRTRGACLLDMVETMSLTRGGYVDVAMLGGMQVSASGDLASWHVPGKLLVGMGGAMDLLASRTRRRRPATAGDDNNDNNNNNNNNNNSDDDDDEGCRVVVLMEHTNRDGTSRVVPQCTLPLTGRGVVDMLITDLAVFVVTRSNNNNDCNGGTLELRELAAGVSLDDVRRQTAAPFRVAATLRTMPLAPVATLPHHTTATVDVGARRDDGLRDVLLRCRGRVVFVTTHRAVQAALLCRFAPHGGGNGASHADYTTSTTRQQHDTRDNDSDSNDSDNEHCVTSCRLACDDDDDDAAREAYLCVFHGEELRDSHGRYSMTHAQTLCSAYKVRNTAATTTLALHSVACAVVRAGLRGVFVHGDAQHATRHAVAPPSSSLPSSLELDGVLYVAAADVWWLASPLVVRPVYVRVVGTTSAPTRSRDACYSNDKTSPPLVSSSSSRMCVTLGAHVLGQLRLPRDDNDDSDSDDDAMLTLVCTAADELGLATTRVYAPLDVLTWCWWRQRVRLPQPLSLAPTSSLSLTVSPHAALHTQILFLRDALAGVVYVLQTPHLRSGLGDLRLLFTIATTGPVTLLRCLRAQTPQPIAVLHAPDDDAVTLYHPLQLLACYSRDDGSSDDGSHDVTTATLTLPLRVVVQSPPSRTSTTTARDDDDDGGCVHSCCCRHKATATATCRDDAAAAAATDSTSAAAYGDDDDDKSSSSSSSGGDALPARLLVDSVVYADGATLWMRRRGSVAQRARHDKAAATSSSSYVRAQDDKDDDNNTSSAVHERRHCRRCCEAHDECALSFVDWSSPSSQPPLLSLLLDALHVALGAARVYALEYALLRRVYATSSSSVCNGRDAAAVGVVDVLCKLVVDVVRGSLPWCRRHRRDARAHNNNTNSDDKNNKSSRCDDDNNVNICLATRPFCLDADVVDALLQSLSSTTMTVSRHAQTRDHTAAAAAAAAMTTTTTTPCTSTPLPDVTWTVHECGLCALVCHLLCESCKLQPSWWPQRARLAQLTRRLCRLLGWRAYVHVYDTLLVDADDDDGDDNNDDDEHNDEDACASTRRWSFAQVLPPHVLRRVFALDDDNNNGGDDDDDTTRLLRGQPPLLYDCLEATLQRCFAASRDGDGGGDDGCHRRCVAWPMLLLLPTTTTTTTSRRYDVATPHPLTLASYLVALYRRAFDNDINNTKHGSDAASPRDEWWRRVCVDVAQHDVLSSSRSLLCAGVSYALLRACCIARERAHPSWADAAVCATIGRRDLVAHTHDDDDDANNDDDDHNAMNGSAARAMTATTSVLRVAAQRATGRCCAATLGNDDGVRLPPDLPRMIRDAPLDEAQTLLNSAAAIVLPGQIELAELQQTELPLRARRAMALPVGRGMLTLCSDRLHARDAVPVPPLTLDGRTADGVDVRNHSAEAQPERLLWPLFHNGVAAGLRLLPLPSPPPLRQQQQHRQRPSRRQEDDDDDDDHAKGSGRDVTPTSATMAGAERAAVTRQWVMYQTRHVPCAAARAGLLLAAGVLGHLRVLQLTDIYSLLVAPPSSSPAPAAAPAASSASPQPQPQSQREAMTMAVMLGLGCSFRATSNDLVFRCLSMHVRALTPSAEDMEVSLDVQSAALVSLGLLCQQSRPASALLVEVLLNEMSRRPSDEHCTRREGYALAAGFGLGLMLLGTGASDHGGGNGNDGSSSSSCSSSVGGWRLDDRLLQMMHGARRAPPAPAAATHEDVDAFAERHTFAPAYGNNNNGNRDSSTSGGGAQFLTRALVTHTARRVLQHTCTLVYEGDCYNAAVSGPAAVMALGMMYVKTHNARIARALRVCACGVDALQAVSPLLTLLRTWMAALVCWSSIAPHAAWLYAQVPQCLLRHAGVTMTTCNNNNNDDNDNNDDDDDLCPAQVQYLRLLLGHSIAGAVLALAMRYAGSANVDARRTIAAQLRGFVDGRVGATALRATAGVCATCVSACAVALGVLCAGSGDRHALALLRPLHARTRGVDYGTHMAVGIACGLLFLGAGRLTLSTSTPSVAALLLALYPRWPRHVDDHEHHLQPLRHFYALAAVPRVLTAVDATTRRPVRVRVRVVLRGSHDDDNNNNTGDATRRAQRATAATATTTRPRDVWLRTPCLYPPPEMVARVEVHSTRHYRTTLTNDDSNNNNDDNDNNDNDSDKDDACTRATSAAITDYGIVLRVQRRARDDYSDSDDDDSGDDDDGDGSDGGDVMPCGNARRHSDTDDDDDDEATRAATRLRRAYTMCERHLLDWLRCLCRRPCRAACVQQHDVTTLTTCAMVDSLRLLRTAQRTLTALDGRRRLVHALVCRRARELVSPDVLVAIDRALEQRYGGLLVLHPQLPPCGHGDDSSGSDAATVAHALHDWLVARRPWRVVVQRARARSNAAHAMLSPCPRHRDDDDDTSHALTCWLAEALHYYRIDGNDTDAVAAALHTCLAAHNDKGNDGASDDACGAVTLRLSAQLAQSSCDVLARLLRCVAAAAPGETCA